MNKKNSKHNKLLQINAFKNEDMIVKERKKTRLENKETINYELGHIYGSW